MSKHKASNLTARADASATEMSFFRLVVGFFHRSLLQNGNTSTEARHRNSLAVAGCWI
jgi:hypothetical protein